jgi:hypothetical protein
VFIKEFVRGLCILFVEVQSHRSISHVSAVSIKSLSLANPRTPENQDFKFSSRIPTLAIQILLYFEDEGG